MEKKELIYKKFEFAYPEIIFTYTTFNQEIIHKILVDNIPWEFFKSHDRKTLDNIFFNIGLSLVPYVYNIDNFNTIRVEAGYLNNYQCDFFSKYFQNGLAETRYRNGLDVKEKIDIISESTEDKSFSANSDKLNNSAIVLNGGGKDTIVAAEILKAIKLNFTWFSLNDTPGRSSIREISGVNKKIIIRKSLDEKVKDKVNRKFKGHKPLSGLLAFLSVLSAYLYDSKYIISANELSSNFGNLNVDGFVINHQYTKSFEFENNFGSYVNKYIHEDIKYFSILRPLYEIQISKIFSNYPEYFYRFLSCNTYQKEGRWCNDCAKCAFVFLMLYAFLDKEIVLKIFGQNLFESETIRGFIYEICNDNQKPFECVGTKDECILALMLSLNKTPETGDLKIKKYNKTLNDLISGVSLEELKRNCLYQFNDENNIPVELRQNIYSYIKERITD